MFTTTFGTASHLFHPPFLTFLCLSHDPPPDSQFTRATPVFRCSSLDPSPILQHGFPPTSLKLQIHVPHIVRHTPPFRCDITVKASPILCPRPIPPSMLPPPHLSPESRAWNHLSPARTLLRPLFNTGRTVSFFSEIVAPALVPSPMRALPQQEDKSIFHSQAPSLLL